jgi:glutathione S-transferase
MRLYDNAISGNTYKCRLLIAQLGIDCERVEVDIMKGESRTPDYLAKNPNGRVPLLALDDGTHLPESNAILFYLAEGTPYMPETREGRARALAWMCFEQYNHEPNVAVARHWTQHLELTNEQRAALPGKIEAGYAALDVMEWHLAANDFFAGKRYSIADIALYAYTHVAEEGGFDLARYPAITAWLTRVAAQVGHIPMEEK